VHSALTAPFELLLVVTMPGVAVTFKSVIDEMTYGSKFKLVNLLQMDNARLTHKNLNTSIDTPANLWNNSLVSYHTSTSGAKLSTNHQLSQCSWSFEIFNKSHQYKKKNSVRCRIVMNAGI
jgi:hypothetical protein